MTHGERALRIEPELRIVALSDVPAVDRGDDLVEVVRQSLSRSAMRLHDGDVLVVASKIVSRAEGRFVDLSTVRPGEEARRLAEEVDRDPRLVELILAESTEVSRKSPSALVVRHRLGFICANAGIDSSNAVPGDADEGTGPWVLLLPEDPDRAAAHLRTALSTHSNALGVVITDSWGRPFRRGTVGFAVGVAGVPPMWDRRGAVDRHGRELQATELALADAIAAAADLVAGQADEGRPLTLVRGVRFQASGQDARALLREREADLYA